MQITLALAHRVLALVDHGLVGRLGDNVLGKMCVEAAICYALDLPHGDQPTCVDDGVRTISIKLNDEKWSSPEARAAGMRRLAIAQLGSKGPLPLGTFESRMRLHFNSVVVPFLLRQAAKASANKRDRATLETAAKRCAKRPSFAILTRTKDTVLAILNRCEAGTDRRPPFFLQALTAAFDLITSPTVKFAVDGLCYTKEADSPAERDAILAELAEVFVQILVDLGSPGAQFLHLTEQ